MSETDTKTPDDREEKPATRRKPGPREPDLANPKAARPGKDFNPDQSNLVKDPDDWVTGEERMTGAQASYLKTLCEEAGEEFDPNLSKAQASMQIDRLQEQVGRGTEASRQRGTQVNATEDE